MIIILFILPIISSLFIMLIGRQIGIKGTKVIALISSYICCGISITELIKIIRYNNIYKLRIIDWINSTIHSTGLELIIDTKTIIMLMVISIITLIIIKYSYWYMNEDPYFNRFISYLLLFSMTMYILVAGNNLFTIFIGWEGVGILSYLLINYWYTIINANKSSIKAVLYNKIGDISIYILIALCMYVSNTSDILIINNIEINDNNIQLFNLLIIIAACAKSAQIFLHCWLGDAMAGPTPVSALLHAATMVTAGIILLLKLESLINDPNHLIVYLGTLTILLGGISAINQYDIKKIIAFSTCSQLGYMFVSFGINSSNTGYYHLFTHAFFKALLFLCAGILIHNLSNEQDIRKLGNFYKILPLTYIIMLIGTISIIAIPFTSGYYSKDSIIDSSINSIYPIYIYILLVIGAILTSIYSIKLIYYVFFNNINTNNKLIFIYKEFPRTLFLYLVTLVIGSIYFGYLFKDIFLNNDQLLPIKSLQTINLDNEWLFYLSNYNFNSNTLLKYIPIIGVFIGICLSTINLRPIYTSYNYNFNIIIYYIHCVFNRRFFFDPLINKISNIFAYIGYNFSFKFIDRGILEYFGPVSIYRLIFSTYNTKLYSNYTYYISNNTCEVKYQVDTDYFNNYLLIIYLFSSLLFIFIFIY